MFLDLPSNPLQWMNLGNWKHLDPSTNFVEACEATARSLADAVCLSKEHRVVDVGFGCGDQNFYFLKHYGVSHIIGYNSSRDQVEIAKSRCVAMEERRFEPRFGVAPLLDVQHESADVVLSLDSAYHYNTRDHFVRESWNWLRPGGRLGLVDLVLNAPPTLPQWFLLLIFSKMIGIPLQNLYDSQDYRKMMEKHGYHDIKFETLDACAFSHLPTFIDRQLDTYGSILNPLLIAKYKMISTGMRLLAKLQLFSFVVVVGSRTK